MKQIRAIFEQYLSNMNRLTAVTLGPEGQQCAGQKDSELLNRRLDRALQFNKCLIIIYVIILHVVFGMSVFLVFYYVDSPAKISVAFGGSFLGILSVLDRLRRLWQEKSLIDIVLAVIRELPPQEVVKVIETLYWNLSHK